MPNVSGINANCEHALSVTLAETLTWSLSGQTVALNCPLPCDPSTGQNKCHGCGAQLFFPWTGLGELLALIPSSLWLPFSHQLELLVSYLEELWQPPMVTSAL